MLMEEYRIGSQKELNRIIENGIIHGHLFLEAREEVSLTGIIKVEGGLYIDYLETIELCNLEEVGESLNIGSYGITPKKIDISKLRRVGGNLNLCNLPIVKIEKLEYVGENVNLKSSDIESFEELKYVGGNVYLPERLRKSDILDGIEISGKIKYFKDNKDKVSTDSKNDDTEASSLPIKKVTYGTKSIKTGPGFYEIITVMDDETEKYYQYFVDNFRHGKVINVRSEIEYPRRLLSEMLCSESDLSIGRISASKWLCNYERLLKVYPDLEEQANHYLRLSSKEYEVGWEVCKRRKDINIGDVGYYEERLSMRLLDVNLMLNINGMVELTDWGKQHIDDIKPFIEKELLDFEKKWNCRFLQTFISKPEKPIDDYSFYKQFYVSEDQYEFYNSLEYGKYIPENFSRELPWVAFHAIKEESKQITVQAEDDYRKSIGMNLIGEFWRSETELYYSIKEAYKNIEVKQHASPKWLGRQHLDVYIPLYNIGIEYQGEQHYKPVEYFGGVEAFEKNLERDERKRILCKNNGCKLIYVEKGYSLTELKKEIDTYIQIQMQTK